MLVRFDARLYGKIIGLWLDFRSFGDDLKTTTLWWLKLTFSVEDGPCPYYFRESRVLMRLFRAVSLLWSCCKWDKLVKIGAVVVEVCNCRQRLFGRWRRRSIQIAESLLGRPGQKLALRNSIWCATWRSCCDSGELLYELGPFCISITDSTY